VSRAHEHINLTFDQTFVRDAEHLQSLKRLAIVEIYLTTCAYTLDQPAVAVLRRRRAQIKTDLHVWKALLIRVLKGSPSKERKFVRWKVSERDVVFDPFECDFEDPASGELEVLPE
jgi:hypothetical protein